MASHSPPRILVFGAHPDDAEVFAGGLIVRHCRQKAHVRIVSVTDGRSGHHQIPPDELKRTRRGEAETAGRLVGAEYITWDFHDGYLQPSLEVREAVIREMRDYQPDLVLTHRPNDYHPDHRAVGTVVQDASYLVTVPHVCPDRAALRRDAVVAYMCDLFTRPNRMRPDIALDISAEYDEVVRMAACHHSQFFEWLPYHDGVLDTVPGDAGERLKWLADRFAAMHTRRHEFFGEVLSGRGFDLQPNPKIEVYEISEYAGQMTEKSREMLFPGFL